MCACLSSSSPSSFTSLKSCLSSGQPLRIAPRYRVPLRAAQRGGGGEGWEEGAESQVYREQSDRNKEVTGANPAAAASIHRVGPGALQTGIQKEREEYND